MLRPHRSIALCAAALTGLVACGDAPADDAPEADESVAFTVTVEGIAADHPFFVSGVFDTPVGDAEPGPLLPGARYELEFHAPPGSRLSFATMFVPSNDLFFAPAGEGIALFDEQGQARSGDLSEEVLLWDAGTELDETLGLGPNQAPQQAGVGAGEPDDEPLRPASDTYEGLPPVSELIGVTLTPGEGNAFTLTIENRSSATSLVLDDGTTSAVPLAPGVFVVHSQPDPLFTVGTDDRAPGLEALAEDGDPGELGVGLDDHSGVVSPVAPGLWSVHAAGEGLFVAGQPDAGLGLEALAEDGDPMMLEASFEGANIGVFGGVYGDDISALEPGGAFILELEASPGEHLSFVSMFGQSNDIFLSTGPEGISLFDAEGQPISRDISAELSLWDAGTEVNEVPGAGPNQAPRQPGPNTGPDEGGVVRLVDDGFDYPAPVELVRVIVSPTE